LRLAIVDEDMPTPVKNCHGADLPAPFGDHGDRRGLRQ
jgi:hypothetical protein